MAILVSKSNAPAYFVYTHQEFLKDLIPDDETKPRVRVKMRRQEDMRSYGEVGELDIEILELSFRAQNALSRAGIRKIKQLLVLSLGDLGRIPGMGKISQADVIDALEECGLYLKYRNA